MLGQTAQYIGIATMLRGLGGACPFLTQPFLTGRNFLTLAAPVDHLGVIRCRQLVFGHRF